MCKVYTGCGTSEIEHCLCACTVDNPLAKARDYLRTGAQSMLYLSLGTSVVVLNVERVQSLLISSVHGYG